MSLFWSIHRDCHCTQITFPLPVCYVLVLLSGFGGKPNNGTKTHRILKVILIILMSGFCFVVELLVVKLESLGILCRCNHIDDRHRKHALPSTAVA
jgi:hypothetical protein